MGQQCSDECQQNLKSMCNPQIFYKIDDEFGYELNPQNITSSSQSNLQPHLYSPNPKQPNSSRNQPIRQPSRDQKELSMQPPTKNDDLDEGKLHIWNTLKELGITEESLSTLNSYQFAIVRENLLKKQSIDIAQLSILRDSRPKGRRVLGNLQSQPSCHAKSRELSIHNRELPQFADQLRTSSIRGRSQSNPTSFPLSHVRGRDQVHRNDGLLEFSDLSSSFGEFTFLQSNNKPTGPLEYSKEYLMRKEEEGQSESQEAQMPTYLAHPWHPDSISS